MQMREKFVLVQFVSNAGNNGNVSFTVAWLIKCIKEHQMH